MTGNHPSAGMLTTGAVKAGGSGITLHCSTHPTPLPPPPKPNTHSPAADAGLSTCLILSELVHSEPKDNRLTAGIRKVPARLGLCCLEGTAAELQAGLEAVATKESAAMALDFSADHTAVEIRHIQPSTIGRKHYVLVFGHPRLFQASLLAATAPSPSPAKNHFSLFSQNLHVIICASTQPIDSFPRARTIKLRTSSIGFLQTAVFSATCHAVRQRTPATASPSTPAGHSCTALCDAGGPGVCASHTTGRTARSRGAAGRRRHRNVYPRRVRSAP